MTETVLALLLERELTRRTGRPVRVRRLSDGSVFDKRHEPHYVGRGTGAPGDPIEWTAADLAGLSLETADDKGPVFLSHEAAIEAWTHPEHLAELLDVLEREIRNPTFDEAAA